MLTLVLLLPEIESSPSFEIDLEEKQAFDQNLALAFISLKLINTKTSVVLNSKIKLLNNYYLLMQSDSMIETNTKMKNQ